jgi:hypothetical protein
MKVNRMSFLSQHRSTEGKYRTIKRAFGIVCIGTLIGAMLAGCSNPLLSGSNKSKANESNAAISDAAKTVGGYCTTLPFISEEARDYYNNGSLRSDYETWKNAYVVNAGAGQLRVQRDGANNYDTVSEGIGYGMLLAVYFNDQGTFDGLYNYAKAHFVSSSVPLMHWKIDQSGNNVSEYADYKIDTTVIPAGTWDGHTSTPDGHYALASQSATVPHGIVYGNLTDGTIWVLPATLSDYATTVKSNLDSSSNYYAMDKYSRGMSSATDADQDIAAALCFALKVWPNGSTSGVNYSTEATNMIKAIKSNDFKSNGFIKNGNAWGDNTGWNPSYFAPAYYLNVFAKQCPDLASFWQTAYDTMYSEMDKIIYYALGKERTALSTSRVFFPDWCNTSSSYPVQATSISDRWYFNNAQPGGAYANSPNGPMYYPMSAAYTLNNTTTKSQYNLHQLSFNSYYDAIRVPWRIATDHIWNDTGNAADKANTVMTPLYNAYQVSWNYGKNPESLKDGYCITCEKWNWAYRDGFNYGVGGQYQATTFYAMAACTLFKDGATAFNPAEWNTVQSTNDYGKPFHYYGNTLRLLSMVFLTGQFVDLYTTKVVTIKSQTLGKYVCAEGKGDAQLVANRNDPGYWETFYLVDLGGGQVALKSQANGKYVCADNNVKDVNGYPELVANRSISTPDQWETFDLVSNSDGSVSFKSHMNGLYVCADKLVGGDNAPLAASRNSIGPWESFYINKR